MTSSAVDESVTQLGQGKERLSHSLPAGRRRQQASLRQPTRPLEGGVQLLAQEDLVERHPECGIERRVTEGVEDLGERESLPARMRKARYRARVELALERRAFIEQTGDVELAHREEALVASPAVPWAVYDGTDLEIRKHGAVEREEPRFLEPGRFLAVVNDRGSLRGPQRIQDWIRSEVVVARDRIRSP